jgi:transcriptional regulator with XRE-family HTH domain
MAHYEGGKRWISVELLVLAANVLNVPIASLLGEARWRHHFFDSASFMASTCNILSASIL